MGRLVEVDEVTLFPASEELVSGFFLDQPTAGTSTNVYALTFAGWFIPSQEPVKQLSLQTERGLPCPVPLNVTRPDVALAHPELGWAAESGFRTSLGVARLSPMFDIRIVANLPERALLLGAVRGRRRTLPAPQDQRFQPIMLTTLARSGGTWVMHLLGQHPSILSLGPFRYEARIARYWMDIFGALADPKSYFQSLFSESTGEHWWLAGSNLEPETMTTHRGFEEWLGSQNVDDLLMLFHERVRKAYEWVATTQHRPDATFFVEKSAPNTLVHSLLPELYPGAREILVVRDFRDMAASMFAYNRKRGFEFFGRDAVSSDEEHIARLGADVAYMLNVCKERSDVGYVLKYEDVIRRPRETLGSLLEYIDVDSEPDVIDQMLYDAESVDAEAQDAHRTAASAEASIGRWRRDLETPLQVACDEAFGEALASLGY